MDTRRIETWGKGVHLKLELEEVWVMVFLLQPLYSHLCKQEIRKREQNFGGSKNMQRCARKT
jgi:hypothetical protein